MKERWKHGSMLQWQENPSRVWLNFCKSKQQVI